MDRQTLRDWVHRFNASGPEGLVDKWTEGPKPRLSAEQVAEFAQIVEAGPERDKDGVVRWRRVDLKRVIAETVRRRLPRALCRDASEEARLLPHQRKAAPSGAGRADRRGVQKNFPRALKAHLQGISETTPIEIWFQMLCSRGLCQTGKPHIWNRSACMSSNVCHQIIYLAIELSSSSWVIAYRVPAKRQG